MLFSPIFFCVNVWFICSWLHFYFLFFYTCNEIRYFIFVTIGILPVTFVISAFYIITSMVAYRYYWPYKILLSKKFPVLPPQLCAKPVHFSSNSPVPCDIQLFLMMLLVVFISMAVWHIHQITISSSSHPAQ